MYVQLMCVIGILITSCILVLLKNQPIIFNNWYFNVVYLYFK